VKKRTNRRSFLRTVGGAGLAATAFPALSSNGEAPAQQSSAKAGRLNKEDLRCAEKLKGIEFTDAQETLALPGVERDLANYETLRKMPVPLDTMPAFSFSPVLPGKKFRTTKRLRTGVIEAPQFKTIEDLSFATTLQLAELVRTRKVTSRALTEMYLDRLKRYGPKLQCVVTLTEELALKQADQADSEIRKGGYRGPLHGIPWGAKDLFATKGIPTTWGAEPFRKQVFDYDAAVVERLHAAGAVLVAKLTTGELASGSGRWFEGVTRNPWNPEDTDVGSSGSSAGSASATAAGLVGFSIGSDTTGSIISPSSRCGASGLRPTFGRVSRYGTMSLCWTFDKIGPICRSVEDCAAVLYHIYGPDGRDLTVGDVPFAWEPAAIDVKKMRIGYLKYQLDSDNSEQIELKKVYQEALDVLKSVAANLQPLEFPPYASLSLKIIATVEAAAAFDDITLNGQVDTLAGQAVNGWPNIFREARFVPAVEYIRAQRVRTLLMREMDALMSKFDVIVTPAREPVSSLASNMTGQPAVVVPSGFVKGLPQAIVFIGRVYEEETPLRVALAYEKATKWHTMHPELNGAMDQQLENPAR
jgi:Asp-tRNA(Asn)/Glu-tRNA(Gln) amidotransferase A subunit family amidase